MVFTTIARRRLCDARFASGLGQSGRARGLVFFHQRSEARAVHVLYVLAELLNVDGFLLAERAVFETRLHELDFLRRELERFEIAAQEDAERIKRFVVIGGQLGRFGARRGDHRAWR